MTQKTTSFLKNISPYLNIIFYPFIIYYFYNTLKEKELKGFAYTIIVLAIILLALSFLLAVLNIWKRFKNKA